MRPRRMNLSDPLGAIRNHASYPRPSPSVALHVLTEMMLAKDPALLEHGRRTAEYAAALGRAIGVSFRDLIDLHFAALLHDIGKVTLPDEVLRKNGALTESEYVLMQCQPREGGRLLQIIPCLRDAAILVAHHHEHWDGSGYPYGLRGAFIPLGSRILAVADQFDALYSDKKGFYGDQQSAMKRMRMLAGSQLDPQLVGIFLHRVEVPSRCISMARMAT